MNVAFLGLGRMGRVLASHVNEEHDLTGWNRSPAAADGLAAAGAHLEEVFAGLDKSMLSAAKDLKLQVFRDGTYGDTQFSAGLLAKDSRLIVHTSRRHS